MDKGSIISLCNLLLVHYSNESNLLLYNIDYKLLDTDDIYTFEYKNRISTSLYIVLKSHLNSDHEKWWDACMIVSLYYCKINLIIHLLQNFSFNINTVLFNTKISTPLMYACKFLKKNTVDKQFDKQFKIIKLLIENGANINIKDNGCTLLMYIFIKSDCTYAQKIQLLDLFIAHGANIDDRGVYNKTLLMFICQQKYTTDQNRSDCVEYLIDKYGANPNLFDRYKNTVLMCLIQLYGYYNYSHTDDRYYVAEYYNNMVELLIIKYKVDVNAINIGDNFNALTMVYQTNLLLSTDIHLLLCTPQNISHIGQYKINSLQYLCKRISTNSRYPHLKRYLTDILSNFKHIDLLYDVLTSQLHHKMPALEFINNSKIEEHQFLAQQLICKVKRKELLTFNYAVQKITEKITEKTAEKTAEKTKLFFYASLKARKYWSMHVTSFLSEDITSLHI